MKMANQITIRLQRCKQQIRVICALALTLVLINLSACKGQKSNDQQRKIKLGVTWFWEKNSEEKFIAMTFRQNSRLTCSIFQIGPNEVNGKIILGILQVTDQEFSLHDTATSRKHGKIIVKSDSAISLFFGSSAEEFKMIVDTSQGKLFNQMRSKYVFECIKSSDISFDKIIPHKTVIDSFLTDKTYIKKIEKLSDEIYGTMERKYLEKSGNKFYYISRGKRNIFDEVVIQSNSLTSTFLDIRIGDTRQAVIQKMAKYNSFLRITDFAITAMVCNQTYLGQIGSISFTFQKTVAVGQQPTLTKITYKPLEEAN